MKESEMEKRRNDEKDTRKKNDRNAEEEPYRTKRRGRNGG